jgi:hypothetical protein
LRYENILQVKKFRQNFETCASGATGHLVSGNGYTNNVMLKVTRDIKHAHIKIIKQRKKKS